MSSQWAEDLKPLHCVLYGRGGGVSVIAMGRGPEAASSRPLQARRRGECHRNGPKT